MFSIIKLDVLTQKCDVCSIKETHPDAVEYVHNLFVDMQKDSELRIVSKDDSYEVYELQSGYFTGSVKTLVFKYFICKFNCIGCEDEEEDTEERPIVD